MVMMRTAGLLRKLTRLEERANTGQSGLPVLERLRDEPSQLLSMAGMAPDPWQEQLLRSRAERTLLLCSRQAGKSTIAAALALRVALTRPHSPILVLSPSMRQSGELF